MGWGFALWTPGSVLMPGPMPKRPHQRRRPNAGLGAVSLPADGPRRPIPPLRGSSTMLASTRRWWAAVWSSPMAAEFLDVDQFPLERLARMIDTFGRGEGTAALLGEIRQLEDRFGLGPVARRRLGWEV